MTTHQPTGPAGRGTDSTGRVGHVGRAEVTGAMTGAHTLGLPTSPASPASPVSPARPARPAGAAGPQGPTNPALVAALRRRERARRRGVHLLLAVMTLLVAVTLSVTVGREYRGLTSTTEYFHRHAYTPSYDPLSNVILGLPPNTVDARTSSPSPDIRGIALRPGEIVLLVGGQQVRSVPLGSPVAGLPGLVRAVNDPTWIETDDTGRVTLHAALIVSPGASLTVTAPVTELVMTAREGVLLGVDGGRLELDSVTVRPDTVGGDPVRHATDERRPFVVANHRATMNITRSRLIYLGRDWNSSYGVTWSDGSTGSMTNSEVAHSFIGTYTDHARNVSIERNWFHDNTLYGVDPHSYSTGIKVRHNISERNGRHGIIFSDHVTDGLVEANITRNNRLNGIMMDASSTGNRIIGNTSAENRGDGIVLASSPDNLIENNTVSANRVGIHARGERHDVELTRNTLVDNELAGQGVDLDGNALRGNGDQWRPRVLIGIWSAVPLTMLLLSGLTGLARRRRDRVSGRRALATGT